MIQSSLSDKTFPSSLQRLPIYCTLFQINSHLLFQAASTLTLKDNTILQVCGSFRPQSKGINKHLSLYFVSFFKAMRLLLTEET